MSLIFVVVESSYSNSSKFSCHQLGVAVKLLADPEVVQVRVRPAHRRLDVFVQLVEGAVLAPGFAARSAGWLSSSVILNW